MSYLADASWDLVPENLPSVKKSCSKCGYRTDFKNSRKFRINANKNQVTIWLIYQCETCKTTWNLTIYERINPKEIDPELYLKFQENNRMLAEAYGFDTAIHKKNGAELDLSRVTFEIRGPVEYHPDTEGIEITLKSSCPTALRMDKLISQKLKISREEVKRLYKKGILYSEVPKLLHAKAADGIRFVICKEYFI